MNAMLTGEVPLPTDSRWQRFVAAGRQIAWLDIEPLPEPITIPAGTEGLLDSKDSFGFLASPLSL